MASLKGPGEAQTFDGSALRIAILHARWNTPIISALVSGTRAALLGAGVRPQNISTASVPGSYELPLAAQQLIAAAQVQQSSTVGAVDDGGATAPFDAVIAIGVLIKGETMHFEYIAEAVSQGLMRVQLDSGVPVVFGLLTVLTEEQGKARAGMVPQAGHNHGEDWGRAAVELGVKRRDWAEGRGL